MALFGSTWPGQQRNMYLSTAVFELLLGTGFIVGALLLPPARFGFILTAVILWGIAFPLFFAWWRTRAKAELEKTGVAGTATVASFTQTGISLNHQPRIELDLQQHAAQGIRPAAPPAAQPAATGGTAGRPVASPS